MSVFSNIVHSTANKFFSNLFISVVHYNLLQFMIIHVLYMLPNSRPHKTRGQERTLQCQLLSGTPVYNICFKYKYHPEALPLLVFIFCLCSFFSPFALMPLISLFQMLWLHRQCSTVFIVICSLFHYADRSANRCNSSNGIHQSRFNHRFLWIHHSFNRLVTQSLLSLPFLLYSSLCTCDHCPRS